MGRLKYTTEEIAEYFSSENCELLDEYTGTFSKMKYKCSCGEMSETTWNNFSKGKRCGNCSKYGLAKKRSIAEVKKIFQERGCEFLDDEFKGIQFKHNYRCKCGREAKISFNGLYHQNQHCLECGKEKNKGPGHHSWKEDREQHRLDQLFRKKCYKALDSSLKATGKTKVGRTSDMLGYGPKELQEHVTNHPNWERVKDTNWHLDHIFPIEAFVKNGIYDMKMINDLDNLQPLTQPENNIKKDDYDKEEFKKWVSEFQS